MLPTTVFIWAFFSSLVLVTGDVVQTGMRGVFIMPYSGHIVSIAASFDALIATPFNSTQNLY